MVSVLQLWYQYRSYRYFVLQTMVLLSPLTYKITNKSWVILVQTRISKAIVTSHITSQNVSSTIGQPSRRMHIVLGTFTCSIYSENYRSRKLMAKRNSSGSHWSNITHAFLRIENGFAHELVRAELRNKRWIIVVLVLKHS